MPPGTEFTEVRERERSVALNSQTSACKASVIQWAAARAGSKEPPWGPRNS